MKVVATRDAVRFVSPLSMATVSGHPVRTDLFEDHAEPTWTQHISLGHWANVLLIAPLSAQTLAKLAHGFADNLLTATVLAARCKVLLCPAMDHDMYVHPTVQANLEQARQLGYHVMEPEHGELASGLTGQGRLPGFEAILTRVAGMHSGALEGVRALVTAGPTREPLDPVRILTNPSTGTMGFALADALACRGAEVTLIAGPTVLPTPSGVRRVDVTTAAQMHEAVLHRRRADLVFMAAAVADYTPAAVSDTKIRKEDSARVLHLAPTRDILAELGQLRQPDQTLVGFAMETDDGLARARKKLEAKRLDWIVLNDLTEPGAGFGTGTNKVTLLSRRGASMALPVMPKRELADALLDRILGARDSGD